MENLLQLKMENGVLRKKLREQRDAKIDHINLIDDYLDDRGIRNDFLVFLDEQKDVQNQMDETIYDNIDQFIISFQGDSKAGKKTISKYLEEMKQSPDQTFELNGLNSKVEITYGFDDGDHEYFINVNGHEYDTTSKDYALEVLTKVAGCHY